MTWSFSFRPPKNLAALLLALCVLTGAAIRAAGQPLAVNDPADSTAPVVRLTAPLDNAELTLRSVVRGEVQSVALASRQLLAAPAGTAPDDLPRWTPLATGTQNVLGELGASDPTLLPNGLWHLQLLATDLANRQSSTLITVEVVGGAKPGLFTVTFLDLEVDAGGIPIRVTRTYDSRRRNEAQFMRRGLPRAGGVGRGMR